GSSYDPCSYSCCQVATPKWRDHRRKGNEQTNQIAIICLRIRRRIGTDRIEEHREASACQQHEAGEMKDGHLPLLVGPPSSCSSWSQFPESRHGEDGGDHPKSCETYPPTCVLYEATERVRARKPDFLSGYNWTGGVNSGNGG